MLCAAGSDIAERGIAAAIPGPCMPPPVCPRRFPKQWHSNTSTCGCQAPLPAPCIVRKMGRLPRSSRLQAELKQALATVEATKEEQEAERQSHAAQLAAERQRHAAELAEERQRHAAQLEAREAQHAVEVGQLMQRVAAAEAKVRSAAGWGKVASLLLPHATALHAGAPGPSICHGTEPWRALPATSRSWPRWLTPCARRNVRRTPCWDPGAPSCRS